MAHTITIEDNTKINFYAIFYCYEIQNKNVSTIYSNIGALSLCYYYATGIGDDYGNPDYSVKLDAGSTYIFVTSKKGGGIAHGMGIVSTYDDNSQGLVTVLFNDRPEQIFFSLEGTTFVMTVRNNTLWIKLALLKLM